VFFSLKSLNIIEPSILRHVKPIYKFSQLETSIYTGLSRFLWGFGSHGGFASHRFFHTWLASSMTWIYLDARGHPHDWYRKPFKNGEFWQMVGTSLHHPSPDHDLVLKHIETIMGGLGIHQNCWTPKMWLYNNNMVIFCNKQHGVFIGVYNNTF